MLIIHSYMNNFCFFFLLYSMAMDSSNIDKHSKASAFKMLKRLLYKHYSRFSKISKITEHLNQFLVLLYHFLHSLRQFLSINKLLKKDNSSQLGTSKYPTTPLYKEITKHEKIL